MNVVTKKKKKKCFYNLLCAGISTYVDMVNWIKELYLAGNQSEVQNKACVWAEQGRHYLVLSSFPNLGLATTARGKPCS